MYRERNQHRRDRGPQVTNEAFEQEAEDNEGFDMVDRQKGQGPLPAGWDKGMRGRGRGGAWGRGRGGGRWARRRSRWAPRRSSTPTSSRRRSRCSRWSASGGRSCRAASPAPWNDSNQQKARQAGVGRRAPRLAGEGADHVPGAHEALGRRPRRRGGARVRHAPVLRQVVRPPVDQGREEARRGGGRAHRPPRDDLRRPAHRRAPRREGARRRARVRHRRHPRGDHGGAALVALVGHCGQPRRQQALLRQAAAHADRHDVVQRDAPRRAGRPARRRRRGVAQLPRAPDDGGVARERVLRAAGAAAAAARPRPHALPPPHTPPPANSPLPAPAGAPAAHRRQVRLRTPRSRSPPTRARRRRSRRRTATPNSRWGRSRRATRSTTASR